jgi:hypothetical protein
MMKMLKQLLVMVFVGLLTMSGVALGALGPPGVGGAQKGDTARDGSCEDVIGVMGEHDGPGCGDGLQHKNGRDDSLGVLFEGTQDRNRDCPDEGPNQNPDPKYGK